MSLHRALPAVALAAVLIALTAPVAAGTCYAVIDRADALVYQSQRPPIDLSDPGAAGAAAREALRKRGELLLVFDSDRCVERVPAATPGKSYATVDEIVASYRSSVGRQSTSGPVTTGIFGVDGSGRNDGYYDGGGYSGGDGFYGGGFLGSGVYGGGRAAAAAVVGAERGAAAVGRAAGRR